MTARRTSTLLRFLDRAVGVPLVAACRLLPKRGMPDPSTVRRVGVYKSAAIGDTLLLTGIFEALRARFPSASIALITGCDNAGVAPFFEHAIDEHATISAARPLAAIRTLRSMRLDVLLECGPWPRVDALVAALSGARYRVGFRAKGQARHYGFDRVVEHSSELHQLENFRNLARAVGATDFPPPRLRAPCVLAPARLPQAPYFVFHPWSGGYMAAFKEWPDERWLELGAALSGRGRDRIVVTGGRGDVERTAALVSAFAELGIPATNAAGAYTIAELSNVLAESAGVVSVNTGVMHLGALIGARTICLDGPTPAKRWGPIGPAARSVSTPLSGCGFLDLGFEYANQRPDCMAGIAVADVVRALEELTGTSSS